MKRQAVCSLIASVLLLGWTVASAQEASFTSADSGFVLVITGVEDVAVLAGSPSIVEGSAILDQAVLGNRLEEQNAFRHSLIQGSFQDNNGILMVNQDTGNFNNQANVRVLVLAEGGSLYQGLSLTGLARRLDNVLISSGGERQNRITNSFDRTVGIVGFNQSAGNANSQANVLVLGVGVVVGSDAVILGDASLGEISAGNTFIQDSPGPQSNFITDSFSGFRGIAQGTQSTGDGNVARNFLGFSLTVVDVR